ILQNVFAFMAKNKPKIVDSVMTKGHPDYGRSIIQPEAYAVNFGCWQRFDYYVSNAGFGQDARNFSRTFWRSKETAKLADRLYKRLARIFRCQSLGGNLLHAIQPCHLSGSCRPEHICFLCGVCENLYIIN